MGAQLDRLRYEVFQNLFYSPMNIGFLRPAVATAPTVYGIETEHIEVVLVGDEQLQQHLPFTVFKLLNVFDHTNKLFLVATAPTVYGIET